MNYTNEEIKQYIKQFDIEICITSIVKDYSIYDINDIIEEPNVQTATIISTQAETELITNEEITIASPYTKKRIVLNTNVNNETVLDELNNFIATLINNQEK